MSYRELAELSKAIETRLSGVKAVITVISGKGGVGKSLISASLALGLSMKGYRVALLDADIHGSSIPYILGITSSDYYVAATLEGNLIPVKLSNNLSIMSIELMMQDRTSPVIWRGPLKTRAIIQMLAMTEWGAQDALIVDLPPGTGDEPLTIAQHLRFKKPYGILVLTPGSLVRHVVEKARRFAEEVGITLIGAVANMAYFKCPVCGSIHRVFGSLEDVGVPLLAEIPLDPELSHALNTGRLAEFLASGGETSMAILALVDAIEVKAGLKS